MRTVMPYSLPRALDHRLCVLHNSTCGGCGETGKDIEGHPASGWTTSPYRGVIELVNNISNHLSCVIEVRSSVEQGRLSMIELQSGMRNEGRVILFCPVALWRPPTTPLYTTSTLAPAPITKVVEDQPLLWPLFFWCGGPLGLCRLPFWLLLAASAAVSGFSYDSCVRGSATLVHHPFRQLSRLVQSLLI